MVQERTSYLNRLNQTNNKQNGRTKTKTKSRHEKKHGKMKNNFFENLSLEEP